MASARQKYDRERILTQSEMVWLIAEDFDRLHWIECGGFRKQKKTSPLNVPGVAEKVAEIMANKGHCVVNIPKKEQ